MALPAGRAAMFSFKGPQGDQGLTGTFADAFAYAVPADETDLKPIITGPESARVITFKAPRGLPGVNGVENDTAVATYLDIEDSESRPAAQRAAGHGMAALDANAARLGLLRSVRPATGYDGVPLKRFRQALAERKTRPVRICHIGDSITAGSGGGLDGRWTSVFRDELREMYPTNGVTTGGRGFLSLNPSNFSPATIVGTAAVQSDTVGFSPDKSIVRLDNAGRSVSYPIVGTGADILYTLQPVGTGGQFYWRVDGGALTVVDTNGVYAGVTSRVAIRGLAAGAHTIEYGHSVTGVINTGGLVEYNGDADSGILSIVAGVGGSTTSFWTANAMRHLDYLGLYNPDLFVIALGTNDFYHATGHLSAAAYKTNLETLIAEIKANSATDPSIVLVAPAVTNAVAPLDPWIDYKTALHAIAAADHDNIAVFDWGYPMNPTSVATTADGLMQGDLVHPTLAGHEFIGKALARFVGVV